MAVNLSPPDSAQIAAVAGVELGFAEAGIKKADRRDLVLMRLAPGSRVAGVFTQNSFAAAPVEICRKHLKAVRAGGSTIRAPSNVALTARMFEPPEIMSTLSHR